MKKVLDKLRIIWYIEYDTIEKGNKGKGHREMPKWTTTKSTTWWDAWHNGHAMAHDAVAQSANPHDSHSTSHNAWARGFKAGAKRGRTYHPRNKPFWSATT